MSDFQVGDIVVSKDLDGLEGLSNKWHEDEVVLVAGDVAQIRCLDGTGDIFTGSFAELERDFRLVRRPS